MRVTADSRVRHTASIDLELIQAAGEGLANALRGDAHLLETMRSGELLHKYFREALGMKPYLEEIGRVMRQLTHRFAHMNILEIGKFYKARSQPLVWITSWLTQSQVLVLELQRLRSFQPSSILLARTPSQTFLAPFLLAFEPNLHPINRRWFSRPSILRARLRTRVSLTTRTTW
jgi:hypothetical protein